jgi:hypothetical protein
MGINPMQGLANSFQSMIGCWNKDNQEPNPDMEYIYNHDLVFPVDSYKSESINNIKGRKIAVNVVFNETRGYNFNFIDDQQTKYSCNYGWAFVPNTLQNITRLQEISKLRQEIRSKEKIIKNIFKELKHL